MTPAVHALGAVGPYTGLPAGPIALVQTPSAPPTTPPGGQGEDFGKSSPVGLVVILLFFVAVIFLVRSMTKHLNRVPASFDPPQEPAGEPGEAGPGPSDHPEQPSA